MIVAAALVAAQLKFRPTDAYVYAQTPWVAFDANFARIAPGQRRVVGFFHRGADGSTREESNVDGPSKPAVLIMNAGRRLQYRLIDGQWHSFPIFLSPVESPPASNNHDPRQYRPAPPIEKIPVLRFVNPQGLIQFVAPSLNDFALRTERPGGGYELFSNVLIRDQPAGLFEPPPGATVFVRAVGP